MFTLWWQAFPTYFHRLTQAVRCMMAKQGYTAIIVYLDDFLVIGAMIEECQQVPDCLLELLQELGFDIRLDWPLCWSDMDFATLVMASIMTSIMDDSASEPFPDVHFYGSIVAATATGDLLSSFNLLVDALDVVKSFFTSNYRTLPKDDFIKRVANEAEDDENTLRYAKDILFAFTERKRKFNLTATFIERKAGEGAVRKLRNKI